MSPKNGNFDEISRVLRIFKILFPCDDSDDGNSDPDSEDGNDFYDNEQIPDLLTVQCSLELLKTMMVFAFRRFFCTTL